MMPLLRPNATAPAPSRPILSCCWSRERVVKCSASRRDVLLAAAAAVPCCCAVCLSRTSFGKSAYQRYFASAMGTMMESYEKEVEPLKERLFARALEEAAASTSSSRERGLDLLDLGCGALPNARLLRRPPSSPSSPPPPRVRSLTGVDVNTFMFPFAEKAAREAGFEVVGDDEEADDDRPTARFVAASAESPSSLLSPSSSGIRDESVDVVLCTLVLCSVPDPAATVAAAARALRPGGVLAFVEHTLDPDPTHRALRLAQRVFDPLQRLLADGCSLTRDPVPVFEGSEDLELMEADRFSVEGAYFIAPHVAGIARKVSSPGPPSKRSG